MQTQNEVTGAPAPAISTAASTPKPAEKSPKKKPKNTEEDFLKKLRQAASKDVVGLRGAARNAAIAQNMMKLLSAVSMQASEVVDEANKKADEEAVEEAVKALRKIGVDRNNGALAVAMVAVVKEVLNMGVDHERVLDQNGDLKAELGSKIKAVFG